MYSITHKNKDQELQTIQTILKDNNYRQQIIHPKQKLISSTNNSQSTQKSKCATFTYCSSNLLTQRDMHSKFLTKKIALIQLTNMDP
jgi:hypothetical protein